MKKGTTFADIFRNSNVDIVIPRLQRNYAQGRASAKDIREQFVEDIRQALVPGGSPLSVDYIYGRSRDYTDRNENRTEFIPLDGQQRLTTLFLLHWYLAVKEGCTDVFLELFARENRFSRFCYKTRKSANDFCNLLVQIAAEKISVADMMAAGTISAYLRNRLEYHLDWRLDSTVQGMLNMLDSFAVVCGSLSNGAFERLIAPAVEDNDQEQRPLFFYYLNQGQNNEPPTHRMSLEEQQERLATERKKDTKLFITMNSRGLPLTSFEKFKAELGLFLSQIGLTQCSQTESNHIPCEHFLWKMDTKWSNYFWKKARCIQTGNAIAAYDNAFLNFIRMYILTCYAGTSALAKEGIEYLMGKKNTNVDNSLSFVQLRRKNVLPKLENAEDVQRFREAFIALEQNLDKFSEFAGMDGIIQKASQYFNFAEAFNEIISADFDITYVSGIMWHAFSRYIACHDTYEGLEDWLRVVWNLTENMRLYYDSYVPFSKAISSIDGLLANMRDMTMLEYLAQGNAIQELPGFRSEQVKEEKIKAWLMCHNSLGNAWRKAIVDAEQHPYFSGQIGFLLYYAGIDVEHFNASEWDNESTMTSALNLFIAYAEKAKAVFACNTTGEDISRVNDVNACFERAVLSKGNYLQGNGKMNLRSTDIRSNNIKRDHSWKRFLRDDKLTRNLVRQVLDDPDFDINHVTDSLEKICAKANPDEIWRRYLVRCPEIFRYCSRGFVCIDSPQAIILFGTAQYNQYHTDLFLKYLEVHFRNKFQNLSITLNESKSHDVLSRLTFRNNEAFELTLTNDNGMGHLECKPVELLEAVDCSFPIEEAESSLTVILNKLANN